MFSRIYSKCKHAEHIRKDARSSKYTVNSMVNIRWEEEEKNLKLYFSSMFYSRVMITKQIISGVLHYSGVQWTLSLAHFSTSFYLP